MSGCISLSAAIVKCITTTRLEARIHCVCACQPIMCPEKLGDPPSLRQKGIQTCSGPETTSIPRLQGGDCRLSSRLAYFQLPPEYQSLCAGAYWNAHHDLPLVNKHDGVHNCSAHLGLFLQRQSLGEWTSKDPDPFAQKMTPSAIDLTSGCTARTSKFTTWRLPERMNLNLHLRKAANITDLPHNCVEKAPG